MKIWEKYPQFDYRADFEDYFRSGDWSASDCRHEDGVSCNQAEYVGDVLVVFCQNCGEIISEERVSD